MRSSFGGFSKSHALQFFLCQNVLVMGYFIVLEVLDAVKMHLANVFLVIIRPIERAGLALVYLGRGYIIPRRP